MECRGALVARIEKKRLGLLCVLTALWQMTALSAGEYLSLLLIRQAGTAGAPLEKMLAACILFGLGVRLMGKAWKNERVAEKREERPAWKPLLLGTAATGMFTAVAGIALGFLGLPPIRAVALAACMSVLGVALGMYTGYRLGDGQKAKAYAVGALLLVAAGVNIVARYF